jgi:hypothetical protein
MGSIQYLIFALLRAHLYEFEICSARFAKARGWFQRRGVQIISVSKNTELLIPTEASGLFPRISPEEIVLGGITQKGTQCIPRLF